MLNLYELNTTYQELITLDLEPEDMIVALNSIEGDIKTKANNIGKVVNTLQGEQLILENEIKRLQGKLKASKGKETNIKTYLSDNLKAMNIDKLECELFKYSFLKSESVVITDVYRIPDKYMVKKVTSAPDKKLLKEAIKKAKETGNGIDGCCLEIKQNMQIK